MVCGFFKFPNQEETLGRALGSVKNDFNKMAQNILNKGPMEVVAKQTALSLKDDDNRNPSVIEKKEEFETNYRNCFGNKLKVGKHPYEKIVIIINDNDDSAGELVLYEENRTPQIEILALMRLIQMERLL